MSSSKEILHPDFKGLADLANPILSYRYLKHAANTIADYYRIAIFVDRRKSFQAVELYNLAMAEAFSDERNHAYALNAFCAALCSRNISFSRSYLPKKKITPYHQSIIDRSTQIVSVAICFSIMRSDFGLTHQCNVSLEGICEIARRIDLHPQYSLFDHLDIAAPCLSIIK